MLGTIAWRKKKEPPFGHVLSIFRSRRFIIRPEICGRLRTATAAAGWVLAMASDTEGKVRNQSTYSCVCVSVSVWALWPPPESARSSPECLPDRRSTARDGQPVSGWERGRAVPEGSASRYDLWVTSSRIRSVEGTVGLIELWDGFENIFANNGNNVIDFQAAINLAFVPEFSKSLVKTLLNPT